MKSQTNVYQKKEELCENVGGQQVQKVGMVEEIKGM